MDVSFASLWLPIVVSAAAVFILSFVMWMVLPHHKSDWKGLPDEDAVMGALRDQGVRVGQFMFPHCANKADWNDPEYKKKYEEGPTGQLVLRGKSSMNMGKNMLVSTCYNLAISALTAYIASFYDPLRRLTEVDNIFQQAIASGERIFELLDETPEIKDAPDAITMDEIEGDVVFDDIHFRYGDGDLFTAHPELDGAPIRVHFRSSRRRYRRLERWGTPAEYRTMSA